MDSVDDDGPHRSSRPPFPEPGSAIGPDGGRYFCLGRLGKGTFCAIYKCVDLSYHHHHHHRAGKRSSNGIGVGIGGGKRRRNGGGGRSRIVAAKVELANFVDSGVIDGEASVLRFLDASLPPGMVPAFADYVRHVPPAGERMAQSSAPSSSAPGGAPTPATAASSASSSSSDGGLSAIIMECLPGEDMHLLRDRHCQQQGLLLAERSAQVSAAAAALAEDGGERAPTTVTRRLSIGDAVYLVADVVLPLLRAMHGVGIVHRDVKPSVSFIVDIICTMCARLRVADEETKTVL